MPVALANYFTKENGSVFTIIPWVGYAFTGGFMASLFYRFRQMNYLYMKSMVLFFLGGITLIWYSSPFFEWLGQQSGISLFQDIAANNYLFIRLGDVLLVFVVFILLRSLMQQKVFLSIGQHTLSIYVIHFMVLYGSLTGIGLYAYWHHSLSPFQAITGAVFFMLFCTWAALKYNQHKASIRTAVLQLLGWVKLRVIRVADNLFRLARILWGRLSRLLSGAEST
jgi:hypothetical protein